MKYNVVIENKVKAFIDAFINEYDFFCYQTVSEFYEKYVTNVPPAESYAGLTDVTYFHGGSKLVLIFDDFDYVIKIPFIYNIDKDEIIDIKKDIDIKENKFFEIFDDTDKCLEEVRISKAAIEANLSRFFALEEYGFAYKGVRIYFQEKVAVTCDQASYYTAYTTYEAQIKEAKEVLPTITSILSEYVYEDLDECEFLSPGLDVFITYLYKACKDKQEFIDLFTFILEEEIVDMHEGNCGYRNSDETEPVLFDYSSF